MIRFPALFLGLLCFSAASAPCAFNSALWKDRISSNDETVRQGALNDLRALNDEEKGQAAAILGSVLHRGPQEAERAATALAVLGPAAEPALLDLVYALAYDEESVAVAVSSAIVPLGGHAVGALRQCADDPNFFVRRRAIAILGRIGPAAAPAAEALATALSDPQYEVQVAAENAIAKVGPATIPALMKAYAEGDETLRRRIVRLLSPFGRAASASLMLIAKKDSNGFVRLNALQGLAQLQPFPKELLPVFIDALNDFDEGVRGGTADALGSLGPAALPTARALKRISENDPDSLVRQKASDALSVILSTETLKK